jgi:hypothetical protein
MVRKMLKLIKAFSPLAKEQHRKDNEKIIENKTTTEKRTASE